jgi:integrase
MPKRKKISDFVDECVKDGVVSPTDIKKKYEEKYPGAKIRELHAYIMALRRKGITKEMRTQITTDHAREKAAKDILDYDEVKSYKLMAESAKVQAAQIQAQLRRIRELWNMMAHTDPRTWTYEALLTRLGQDIEKTEDSRGRSVFSKPGRVMNYLCCFNTLFPGHLPKGWSSGLHKHDAGELKDFLTFQETDSLLMSLEDTKAMTALGWRALFKAQINMGCREGTLGKNGIVSLTWADIDYKNKRAKLHEKGGRGKAGRVWEHLPLDLFSWLHGWEDLTAWCEQLFGYRPTATQYPEGRVFPVSYQEYNEAFHAARRKANGRISLEGETLHPHILRKTHAQWCKKLRIPLELICGAFPDGWFGVGWDNPQILLKYYVSIEEDEIETAQAQAQARIQALGL